MGTGQTSTNRYSTPYHDWQQPLFAHPLQSSSTGTAVHKRPHVLQNRCHARTTTFCSHLLRWGRQRQPCPCSAGRSAVARKYRHRPSLYVKTRLSQQLKHVISRCFPTSSRDTDAEDRVSGPSRSPCSTKRPAKCCQCARTWSSSEDRARPRALA